MATAFPRIGYCICAVLLAGTGPAAAQERRMERTITVAASGTVNAAPDIARIRMGVVSEAKTAREALSRNSELMTKVVAGLKAQGIEPRDIQTSSFNVEPRYTGGRDGEPVVIDGYRVRNDVAIIARDLDRLGDLLDALVTLGVNQVDGLSFEVSKAETLKDDARKEAMANARRRAELLAAAGGAEVGEVMSISEDAAVAIPRAVSFTREAVAKAVPIERGTEELEARVTVTWALR